MINLKAMIKPISAASQVGVDPRRAASSIQSLYSSIKDARKEARSQERLYWQGEGPNRSKSHWEKVCVNSINLLTNSSKDLEVAAWLVESLLRLDGFAGLSDGFLLVNKLVSKFKHQLFPELDENEGLEFKLQSLIGLNGEEVAGSLIQPISNVPISLSPEFTLWQYQQAVQFKDKVIKPEDRPFGLVEYNEIVHAVANTSRDFYIQLRTSLSQSIEQFEQLNKTLDKEFGSDAPPCTRILEALLEYQQQLKLMLKENNLHKDLSAANSGKADKSSSQLSASSVGVSKSNNPSSLPASDTVASSSMYTRETALIELANIAQFFSAAEPQSILPYMLNRVVEWARLPLPDLLSKIVTNSAELAQVYALTGVESKRID